MNEPYEYAIDDDSAIEINRPMELQPYINEIAVPIPKTDIIHAIRTMKKMRKRKINFLSLFLSILSFGIGLFSTILVSKITYDMHSLIFWIAGITCAIGIVGTIIFFFIPNNISLTENIAIAINSFEKIIMEDIK